MTWSLLDGVGSVAVSAGASAPEELVDQLIEACRARYQVALREIRVVQEDVAFKTPPIPMRQAS
jgi:4-hydroxy-3-methylbut-2-enyl diphosphate reductase